jgi:hypothetical protein
MVHSANGDRSGGFNPYTPRATAPAGPGMPPDTVPGPAAVAQSVRVRSDIERSTCAIANTISPPATTLRASIASCHR